ncbi:hypothetical protein PENSPDRAFT_688972 [Peniophora sp. CONT]|nr:hypothetical protein PENSPDRAFT_688972 [Peniophora sp. CONT]
MDSSGDVVLVGGVASCSQSGDDSLSLSARTSKTDLTDIEVHGDDGTAQFRDDGEDGFDCDATASLAIPLIPYSIFVNAHYSDQQIGSSMTVQSRTPVEIIHYILQLAVFGFPERSRCSQSCFDYLRIIVGVCRDWAIIAVNSPHFWAQVLAYVPDFSTFSRIRRLSANVPIDLSSQSGLSMDDLVEFFPYARSIEIYDDEPGRSWNIELNKHATMWKLERAWFCRHYVDGDATPRLILRAPNLVELTIDTAASIQAPNLRRLTIHHLGPRAIDVQDVVSLIKNAPLLEVLDIATLPSEHDVDWTTALSTNLSTAHITEICIGPGDALSLQWSQQKLRLPVARSVCLSTPIAIDAPGVACLQVCGIAIPDLQIILSGAANIETLIVFGGVWEGDMIAQCCTVPFPVLNQLSTIEFRPPLDEYVVALLDKISPPPTCLVEFVIECPPSEECSGDGDVPCVCHSCDMDWQLLDSQMGPLLSLCDVVRNALSGDIHLSIETNVFSGGVDSTVVEIVFNARGWIGKHFQARRPGVQLRGAWPISPSSTADPYGTYWGTFAHYLTAYASDRAVSIQTRVNYSGSNSNRGPNSAVFVNSTLVPDPLRLLDSRTAGLMHTNLAAMINIVVVEIQVLRSFEEEGVGLLQALGVESHMRNIPLPHLRTLRLMALNDHPAVRIARGTWFRDVMDIATTTPNKSAPSNDVEHVARNSSQDIGVNATTLWAPQLPHDCAEPQRERARRYAFMRHMPAWHFRYSEYRLHDWFCAAPLQSFRSHPSSRTPSTPPTTAALPLGSTPLIPSNTSESQAAPIDTSADVDTSIQQLPTATTRRSLPCEVWERIFYCASCTLRLTDCHQTVNALTMILRLATVCRDWAWIISNHQRLWASVAPWARTDWYLQRLQWAAGACALDMSTTSTLDLPFDDYWAKARVWEVDRRLFDWDSIMTNRGPFEYLRYASFARPNARSNPQTTATLQSERPTLNAPHLQQVTLDRPMNVMSRELRLLCLGPQFCETAGVEDFKSLSRLLPTLETLYIHPQSTQGVPWTTYLADFSSPSLSQVFLLDGGGVSLPPGARHIRWPNANRIVLNSPLLLDVASTGADVTLGVMPIPDFLAVLRCFPNTFSLSFSGLVAEPDDPPLSFEGMGPRRVDSVEYSGELNDGFFAVTDHVDMGLTTVIKVNQKVSTERRRRKDGEWPRLGCAHSLNANDAVTLECLALRRFRTAFEPHVGKEATLNITTRTKIGEDVQHVLFSSESADNEPTPCLGRLARGRALQLDAIVCAIQCPSSLERGFDVSVAHMLCAFASSRIKTLRWSVDIQDERGPDPWAAWPNNLPVNGTICLHEHCSAAVTMQNFHGRSHCFCDDEWGVLPDRGHWLAVDPFAIPRDSTALDDVLRQSLTEMVTSHS